MTEPTSDVSAINKQTIKALKERIRKAGSQRVQKKLGFTRFNFSYHLNPKDFSKVNIGVLERITAAVAQVEKENLERAVKVHKQATATT
jgi:hypothetical protein